MVESASASGPVPAKGSSGKTPSSKKPSPYILDSNGDTQLILNTHKDQSFSWRGERVWIGQKGCTMEYLEKEGEELSPLSYPPSAPSDSPVSSPTSFMETNGELSAGFDGTGDEYSEPLNEGAIKPGCTDAEVNANSSTLRVQDWHYGETSGIIPGQVEIRMLVSGKHLALASSYFQKMLAGPYIEGRAGHSGLYQVKASDWDPEAFNIILTIIHGFHRHVPKSLSLEMLAKLAMIVDYYNCHESIELHADIWLANLESQLPTVYGRDCILGMVISWVFMQPDMFRKMAQLALRHSGTLIEADDLPIPDNLLEQVDKARQDFLSEIFSAIYDLLDILQEEPQCSYECSCMLLGVLTKELRKHGILSPRSAQPFYGLSIEGAKRMIKGFRVPCWNVIKGGRLASHNCTIQQKLWPVLEKAEKGLHVFNLQDFQIAKVHTSQEELRGVLAQLRWIRGQTYGQ